MKVERVFRAVMVVVALALMWTARTFVPPIAYDPIGPRPYPMLLLGLLVAACLYLALRPPALAERLDLGYTPLILRNVALCLLALLAYAMLFEMLGFIIATALMCFAVGLLFGGSIKKSAVAGIASGVFFYLLFDVALDVPLPLGPLG